MILYINESILNESVNGDEVIEAIDKKVGVVVNYDDGDGHNGPRYIEPYVYGLTSKNNPAIRVYQYYGDTKRGVPSWKLLRLDRITSWKPTDNKFNIDPKARGFAKEAFNGNDKSLPVIYKVIDFGRNEELSDIDILKAKTERLKNSKPMNISDFIASKNNQPKKTEKVQRGPVNQDKTDKNEGPVQTPDNGTQDKDIQKQNGPIVNNVENNAEDVMSDDEFKDNLTKEYNQ